MRKTSPILLLVLLGLAGAWVFGRMSWTDAPQDRPRMAAPKQGPERTPERPFASPNPLASFQARDEGRIGAPTFRGGAYVGQVGPEGLRFEQAGVVFRTRGASLEQGGVVREGTRGEPDRTAPGRARVDRGAFIEEYIFENNRVEQLFHIPEPIGTGSIRLRAAVETTLSGPVQAMKRGEVGWRETPLFEGGLSFSDGAGEKRLSYTGAVAIDAAGRSTELDPRFEGGAIVLEVPESFVSKALFPIVVDPWIQVGFSASGGGISGTGKMQRCSIAVNAAGNPSVAWTDQDPVNGDSEVYFRRWDGTGWVELGGSATGGGVSTNAGNNFSGISLALDSSGNPVIAWDDFSGGGGTSIYVRRWNGTAWAELGGSGSGMGISGVAGSSFPSLALDATGNPVVAWSGAQEIYLRRWDGLAWVGIGGSESGGGISGTAAASNVPSLKLDAAGNPVVAWYEGPYNSEEIFLRRWNGAAWVEVGGSATSGGVSGTAESSIRPSLALDSAGDPVIAWSEYYIPYAAYQVSVARWDAVGTAWVPYGANPRITNGPGNSSYTSLAIDGSNRPLVAWHSNGVGVGTGQVERYAIRAARWSGTSWSDIAGSYFGPGLSQTAGDCYSPSLALDGAGDPFVAWTDTTFGGDAYLRRFTSQAPTLSGLDQRRLDGTTSIAVGETTPQGAGVFRATLAYPPAPDLRLEVEVALVGTAFTGTPSAESPPVPGGSVATIVLPLADGSYHWRARIRDAEGLPTAWVSFGGNAETATDLVVSFSGGGTTIIEGDSNSCGALGPEFLLLPGLVLLLRRRRARRPGIGDPARDA